MEQDLGFFIRPYLNISYKIEEPGVTVENLTSKMQSPDIEKTFIKYAKETIIGIFLNYNFIDGCSGTFVNSNT